MLAKSFTRSFILMGALMAVLAVIAIACAADEDETPAPAGVSAQEIRQIVSEEVAMSQQPAAPQVSMEEIGAMVKNAMAGLAASVEGMSPEEIQAMVEGAVAAAAEQGASPEEIQAMVEGAVKAATAGAVTGEEVQSAITKAVMDAQAGMITSTDVETAVSSAVMGAQAGMITSEDVETAVSSAVMDAQSGMITSEDVETVVSSAVMEAAANSLTAAEIEEIVSTALEQRAMMEQVPRETIIFSDLNWPSAQYQNRIVQYIAEHGYGYPTDVQFGGTLPNFEGLKNGDIHVTMEIWLPNQDIGWTEAVEIGNVVSVGTSLVGDWQSTFVIPKYIADAHPDLKTPEDLRLPKFQELFATPDSGGKARLIGCVLTWSCAKVNEAQIEAYGLNDYIHLISAGSTAFLNADFYGAYEKMEPWLGYQWGTNKPPLDPEVDLVLLEEAPYSKECWDADKACHFADSLVLIAVHKSVLPRAPEIIDLLQNWEYSVPTHDKLDKWVGAEEGREASDAAVYYLTTTTDWESWITPEALGRVRDALANES